jgi:hypothetical protein
MNYNHKKNKTYCVKPKVIRYLNMMYIIEDYINNKNIDIKSDYKNLYKVGLDFMDNYYNKEDCNINNNKKQMINSDSKKEVVKVSDNTIKTKDVLDDNTRDDISMNSSINSNNSSNRRKILDNSELELSLGVSLDITDHSINCIDNYKSISDDEDTNNLKTFKIYDNDDKNINNNNDDAYKKMLINNIEYSRSRTNLLRSKINKLIHICNNEYITGITNKRFIMYDDDNINYNLKKRRIYM